MCVSPCNPAAGVNGRRLPRCSVGYPVKRGNAAIGVTGVRGVSGMLLASTSTEPMSHPLPCGRVTPRWSVVVPSAPSAWQLAGGMAFEQQAPGLGEQRLRRTAVGTQRTEAGRPGALAVTGAGEVARRVIGEVVATRTRRTAATAVGAGERLGDDRPERVDRGLGVDVATVVRASSRRRCCTRG